MRRILFVAMFLTVIPVPGLTAELEMESVLQGHTLYRLLVDGLVCSFCAYRVEQKLQAVSGVEYVDVDIDSGRIMVGLQPDYHLDEIRVRTLIEEAGFLFKSLERRPMTREALEGVE